jgi:DNA-binding CsgD family transcriptional regulator
MHGLGAAVAGDNWIVGRDAELQRVWSFLAHEDDRRALLIEGEAGAGKTTLWQAAVRECRKRGRRVLECSPTVPESTLSFTGLGDLLTPVLEEALPLLAEPRRRALEGALLITDSVTGAPLQRRAIGLGVLDVLHRLAEDSPVVVAIDDVQWLDESSSAALEFALRRLTGAPVLVLASRRVGEAPVASGDVVAAFGQESIESVAVGALSLGAIGHLLRARLDGPLSRPDVRRIHDASGGNPLFALELARSLRGRHLDLPALPLRLPPTLQALIEERLARLSPPAAKVAFVAAALADPRLDIVERVAGEGLIECVDLGVVVLDGDRARFTHPLYASGVYSAASAEERRAVHTRLAAIVQDPEERAQHLAAVAVGPDDAVAAAIEEAAASVRARGAPQSAAVLAERAAELTPAADGEAACRRLTLAGGYAFAAGETARALELVDRAVAAVPACATRARALHMKARVLYFAEPGRDVVLRGVLRQGAAEAAGMPVVEAAALTLLLALKPWNLPERDAQIARLTALATVEPLAERQLLVARAYSGFFRGEGLATTALERAIELDEGTLISHVTFRASGLLGELLERAARFDQARPLLEASYQSALDEGDEASLPDRAGFLAELELAVGNWQAAERLADESLDFARSSQQLLWEAIAEGHRARVAAHLGQEDAARAAADRCSTLTSGGLVVADLAFTALGLLELSLGDYVEAERHLAALEEWADGVGVREPAAWKYEGDRIEALLGLGELGRARILVERLEERSVPLGSAWSLAVGARCRGLLLAAEGDLEGAAAALDDALAHHEQLGMPFERARTMLALGQLRRRIKRRAAARAALTEALAVFRTLGARIWIDRTQAELDRIGGRAPTGSALTPTEARIAGLVASGCSNKEVAARLFVTVHTVEVNLTRIYAKLGIHSRRELPRTLGAGASRM